MGRTLGNHDGDSDFQGELFKTLPKSYSWCPWKCKGLIQLTNLIYVLISIYYIFYLNYFSQSCCIFHLYTNMVRGASCYNILLLSLSLRRRIHLSRFQVRLRNLMQPLTFLVFWKSSSQILLCLTKICFKIFKTNITYLTG